MTRLTIKPWFAKKQGLYSRVFDGEVVRETDRALLFDGTVCLAESAQCHRCGREITNPVSRLVGYGPFCSEELGITRPDGLNAEEFEMLKRRVSEQQKREMWVPKSVVVGRKVV